MKITTRSEAEQAGLKHFFTGKPCRNGHFDVRHVSTEDCIQCKKERAERERAVKLAWIDAHPGVHEVINAIRRTRNDIKASGLTKKEYFRLHELEFENRVLRANHALQDMQKQRTKSSR